MDLGENFELIFNTLKGTTRTQCFLTLSLSLSLSHTHIHTHTHSLHSHTHTHTHYTHTHPHYTHTPTHTHTTLPQHIHTHTHTTLPTHPHKHSISLCLPLKQSFQTPSINYNAILFVVDLFFFETLTTTIIEKNLVILDIQVNIKEHFCIALY